MHGLFIALGKAANDMSRDILLASWQDVSRASVEFFAKDNEIFVACLQPKRERLLPSIVWSEDKNICIVIDGYLITDLTTADQSIEDNLSYLVKLVCERGVSSALKAIISGSFNMAIFDIENRSYSICNDMTGSVPLYYTQYDDSCLLSTNPVALISTALLSHTIDYTACAEFAYIGYTIGDRYFTKETKIFPPASVLTCDNKARSCTIGASHLNPYTILPSETTYESTRHVDEVAANVLRSCNQLSNLGRDTAHLQSGGFDSRLILAAWPKDRDLPCYTYGNPNSFEISVARSAALTRGSPWDHIWPDGDQVADCVENMFAANGMVVYPDRFLTARKISGQGFRNVLDGQFGFLFSGDFYSCDKYFSSLGKYARYLTKFIDQKVSKIGLDAITEALFHDIQDSNTDSFLTENCTQDFVRKLQSEKDNILQDIHNQLIKYADQTNSVAIVFRNFKMNNRTRNAISQQGVMTRQFLQVFFPFNDFKLMKTLLKLPPTVTAYKRFYIQLYKRHFPIYGDLPYSSSLQPVRRAPMFHKWSAILANKQIIPEFIRNRRSTRDRDPDNWHLWFKGSNLLRQKAIQFLSQTGVGDPRRVEKKMTQFALGTQSAKGKIFHLASISKWLGLSNA